MPALALGKLTFHGGHSHRDKPLHYREQDQRGEGPGQGCWGVGGQGWLPGGSTGASTQGPGEACKEQRGWGRPFPVPPPQFKTLLIFSGQVALLDSTVPLIILSIVIQGSIWKKLKVAVSASLPNDLVNTAGCAQKASTKATKWRVGDKDSRALPLRHVVPNNQACSPWAPGRLCSQEEGSETEAGLGLCQGPCLPGETTPTLQDHLGVKQPPTGEPEPPPHPWVEGAGGKASQGWRPTETQTRIGPGKAEDS